MINNKKYSIRVARANGHTVLPNGITVPYARFTGGHNDNIVAIGGSGSGKTRGIAEANIISGVGSMIISDTKGTLYNKYSEKLKKLGYTVKHLNFIDPTDSMHYNPLEYIESSNDVQKLSNMIVYLGLNMDNIRDPFWPRAEAMFLNAVIGGIFAFVTGSFSAEALLLNAITMLTAALLAPTLMLPVLFRYGVSKGRIVYYVLIGVSAALMTLSGGRTAEPLPALSVGRALLALGMTACLYVLSIALSVKLYGRYERK